MKIIDRKTRPSFVKPNLSNIPVPDRVHLSNGIPVYFINNGNEEVVKMDMVFSAGSAYQTMPFIAHATNAMLPEGTRKNSAADIAEQFDFHGALFQPASDQDYGWLSLVTLNKYIDKLLPLVFELLTQATFPENELETLIKKRKQNLTIDLTKPKFLAKRRFNEMLYGAAHPYGKSIKPENFDPIHQHHLIHFYNHFYTPSNCKIIVSGKLPNHIENTLENNFGKSDWGKQFLNPDLDFNPIPENMQKDWVEKDDAVQSAIQVGRVLFAKDHPDFQSMFVLNTLLGGYFGSRLMSNIREDKGYTYGINSHLVNFVHSGYFVIATETGTEVTQPALNEIYSELERLQNEPVGKNELELVRNFIVGDILNHFDGPFALSETFRSLIDYRLDFEYYTRLLKTINEITPGKIQNLARKYLNRENLVEVVSGKKGKS